MIAYTYYSPNYYAGVIYLPLTMIILVCIIMVRRTNIITLHFYWPSLPIMPTIGYVLSVHKKYLAYVYYSMQAKVINRLTQLSFLLQSRLMLDADRYTSHGVYTVPSRKRAHGQCTLHWAEIGGWADIQGISIAFIRERAPRQGQLRVGQFGGGQSGTHKFYNKSCS